MGNKIMPMSKQSLGHVVLLVSLIVSLGDASPSPVLDFLDPFLPQDESHRGNQGLNKDLSASGAAAGHVGADLGGVGFDAGGAVAGSKSLDFHKDKGGFLDKGPSYIPPPPPPHRQPLPPPPCNHGPQPRPFPPQQQQPYHQQQQYRPNQQPHYRNTADMDGPDESLVAVDFDKDGDVDEDDAHAMAVMNQKAGNKNLAKRGSELVILLPVQKAQNATQPNASNSTLKGKVERNLDVHFGPLPKQVQYQNQPGRKTRNAGTPARPHQAPGRIVSPKFRNQAHGAL